MLYTKIARDLDKALKAFAPHSASLPVEIARDALGVVHFEMRFRAGASAQSRTAENEGWWAALGKPRSCTPPQD